LALRGFKFPWRPCCGNFSKRYDRKGLSSGIFLTPNVVVPPCSVFLNIRCHFLCTRYNGNNSLMELNPHWRANSYSGVQETLSIIRNEKFYYCFHRRPSLVPIFSQMDPIHILILLFWDSF
jgi:hypothetical protein